ncbi:cytochrome oxidase small assembly protein [Aquariibacter lacus]|nr:cytochrome oxidase small assembly protein [Piscinibacter lacus]
MAAAPQDPRQRKSNLRLGLILASVAAAFAIGFAAKIVMLGG